MLATLTIGGDLFRPSLLFYPLIIPGCVRIGGDGHPGAHGLLPIFWSTS
jgi:hypothetical protein